MTPQSTEVLIAGAGPTGLMLALWLTRLGIKVNIVDPKPGPTQETRAIAVQARTLELYDQLGLGEEALSRGRSFARLNIWTRGHLRAAVRLRGMGDDLTPHPNLYILTQDQNEALLLSHLQALGGAVEWQTELTDFEQNESGVTATLSRAGQTQTVRATYLAGCDGASSAVRHGLGVPLSGGTYAQRFYVADVLLSAEEHENDVNVSLDDDEFLAFFPMPGPHRCRIVGQVPPNMGGAVTFETVRPHIEKQRVAEVKQVHWFSTYRVHHRVADQFQSGRVFLLGDAAHVHSPVGGQGMNTGLGDAVNLAWKLAQAVRGRPAALSTYGPERRPFALWLVNFTDRAFSGIVDPKPLARFLRTRLIPPLLSAVARPAAVRRKLFLTLSQISLHYPDSSLSVGQAGRVGGGDRLPWVPNGAGSNFTALRSLNWQVHVYGTPSPELLTWCGQHNLPLKVFPYGAAATRAGLQEDAFYLVRPDGHVGLAAPHFERELAEQYVGRWLDNRS